MHSRERLLAVLHGQIPDCVPACPDISNMIPALRKTCSEAVQFFEFDGGRDASLENLFAVVETARTYGRYA